MLLLDPRQQHLDRLFLVVVSVVVFDSSNVRLTQFQLASQLFPISDFLCDMCKGISSEWLLRFPYCFPYLLLTVHTINCIEDNSADFIKSIVG